MQIDQITKSNLPSLVVMAAKQLWILAAKLSQSTVFFDTEICGALSNDCSIQFCVKPINNIMHSHTITSSDGQQLTTL